MSVETNINGSESEIILKNGLLVSMSYSIPLQSSGG